MLKRLIIAVFGISLMLAFGSIALAGPGGIISPDDQLAGDRFIPNHPKLNQVQDARPVQPTFKKPASALRLLPSGSQAPAPPSSIYFCDLQDYSGPGAFFWTIPDAFGDDLFNSRFTVEANFECTLKAAYLAMYGPAMTGTPDMRVYLWADDGFGFPGAVLDSVDIPFALLPVGYAYVVADFSAAAWVFADGDEYHYGYTTLGGPGDVLAITSDNGLGPYSGEERSSEYYLGAWGSMLNDWGGDYTFNIVSDRCCNEIPFSDCYTQSYWGGISFFWRTPHPTFGDSSWAMRFDVGGPETLSSVDIAIYGGGGSLGDEDVHITVYDDDGAGYPGAQIAQVTLPGGTYSLFPSFENVPFAPLVLNNTFHVAFSSAGVPGVSWESTLSDNGTFGVSRSSGSGDPTWPGPGTWYSMLAWWGGDYNFLFDANLCRDEFSDCAVQNYFPPGDAVPTNYPIPDGNPVTQWAQKFSNAPSGSECELREFRLNFGRTSFDIPGRPLMYTFNTLAHVVADAGGYPTGAVLHTETYTPADYAAAGYTGAGFIGNFMITRSVNVVVPGNFWIVVEPLAPTRATGIRHAMRLFDSNGGPVDVMAAYFGGTWDHADDLFGTTSDGAMDINAQVCCVPFSGRVCAPAGDDWSSRSHDLARSGASQLPIGDAWCDLTRDWFADDLNAAATALTMGPIIYEGRVYQILETAAAGSSIRVFDLTTGALLGTISGAPLGNFAENDPLIVSDKLYVCGGDNRVVSRWDVSGVAVPVAPDWTRTIAAAAGPLRRANLLLVGAVLYGGSQTGRVFAINESDGLDFPGWVTNPITLDAGQLVQGSATDGVRLYFGTRQAGLNGDVWTINPATGAVLWKLSTAGGYQGLTVYASITSEAFPQISTENDILYVGGRPTGSFPTDGLFYRLDAGTGAVLSVAQAVGFLFANPIIDVNLVYALGTTAWLPTNLGVDLFAYNKNNGALAWLSEYTYEPGALARYFNNGLLTCEPEPDADIIISADEKGHVFFNNSIDGSQLFRRRFDFGAPGQTSTGGGVAIGTDGVGDVHVVIGSNRGGLVSLKKGADRSRIEIQNYDPTLAVEFSVLPSVIYTEADIITNTGCVDLTFSAVNVDDVSFGMTDPGIAPFSPIRPGLLDASGNLADQMASGAKMFKEYSPVNENSAGFNEQMVTTSDEESYRDNRGYRAASAFPAYINSVLSPFVGQVVAAGDSIDLVLDVDPSQINRGPQVFYIELVTNDPDYFLNAGSVALPNADPMLTITLVGGCLTDTTALEFGVGGANYQWVTNTGRLADGDWTAHGMEIDGEDALMYQGTYIFGVSRERIASNSADWSGATGQEASWISIQGDPNYCDNSCKPALFTGVSLGAMWNGAAYVPILGNLVCKSWIDSVQNFSSNPAVVTPAVGLWDWKRFTAPFNDSLTMGLTANTRTVGALNVPELANLTVEIFEVSERNGASVDSFKFGVNIDYDVSPTLGGGADTSILNRNISAAWTTSAQSGAADFAWGFIKLPYGCGYTPIKNAKGLDAGQGRFIGFGGAARGDGYMDSAYIYMNNAPGANPSHQMTGSADQQIHGTLVENDFGPNESITFAVAQFGFNSGVTSPRTPGSPEIVALSNLANKWVGFGRGDVNDDNAVNLGDIMMLADIVGGSVPGAIPFEHLGDVDADNDVDNADLNYLIAYYFDCGACPLGDWVF